MQSKRTGRVLPVATTPFDPDNFTALNEAGKCANEHIHALYNNLPPIGDKNRFEDVKDDDNEDATAGVAADDHYDSDEGLYAGAPASKAIAPQDFQFRETFLFFDANRLPPVSIVTDTISSPSKDPQERYA
jgi:hypothetical protein